MPIHLTVRSNDRGRFTIHSLLPATRVRFLEFVAEPLNFRTATLRVELRDRALRDRVSGSRRRRIAIPRWQLDDPEFREVVDSVRAHCLQS